jgi:hypothetical protein
MKLLTALYFLSMAWMATANNVRRVSTGKNNMPDTKLLAHVDLTPTASAEIIMVGGEALAVKALGDEDDAEILSEFMGSADKEDIVALYKKWVGDDVPAELEEASGRMKASHDNDNGDGDDRSLYNFCTGYVQGNGPNNGCLMNCGGNHAASIYGHQTHSELQSVQQTYVNHAIYIWLGNTWSLVTWEQVPPNSISMILATASRYQTVGWKSETLCFGGTYHWRYYTF